MKNFQKKTLLKMAQVKMGMVFFPHITLKIMVIKAKTTKQANVDFLFLLTALNYRRILENFGEADWNYAEQDTKEFMLELRKRV
jgi:hypothetical protein